MVAIFVLLLLLLFAYVAGIYLGVLLHEAGHAATALALTRLPVVLEVGRAKRPAVRRLGRLTLRLGLRSFRYGFTRYDRAAVSRGKQAFVAAAGPMVTLAVCAALLWAMVNVPGGSIVWVALLGLFVSNLRILVAALWPAPYRPDGPAGEVWLSDALDLWQLWRGPR